MWVGFLEDMEPKQLWEGRWLLGALPMAQWTRVPSRQQGPAVWAVCGELLEGPALRPAVRRRVACPCQEGHRALVAVWWSPWPRGLSACCWGNYGFLSLRPQHSCEAEMRKVRLGTWGPERVVGWVSALGTKDPRNFLEFL